MTDRRSTDRRRRQHTIEEGWKGIERRSKRDRRLKDRRRGSNPADPDMQMSKQLQLERREKEHKISDERKQARLRKERGVK